MSPMLHPPYSPHLAPSDFFFVSPYEKSAQREMFADVKEVKHKTAEALKGIKIDKFKNSFEQWEKHRYQCIVSNGEYFEGD